MTLQNVDPRDPDGERQKDECDHLHLENVKLDDSSAYHATVSAFCADCSALLEANVDIEDFGRVT